jgi:hypothetical protein
VVGEGAPRRKQRSVASPQIPLPASSLNVSPSFCNSPWMRWPPQSRGSRPARHGRPRPAGQAAPVAPDILALIRHNARCQPALGRPAHPRRVAETRAHVQRGRWQRYLGRRDAPLFPTWRTFLTNHVAQLASIDFFMVPTASVRALEVREPALPNNV